MILKRKGALREAQRYAKLIRRVFQKRDVGKYDNLTVTLKTGLGEKIYVEANLY